MTLTSPLAITEKEWSDQLVGTAGNPGLARALGWDGYHTLRSKGSASGYPDWHLWRDRSIFLELKTETGKVSERQAETIRALHKAGNEVYVVRPRHLEEIAKVLQTRAPIAMLLDQHVANVGVLLPQLIAELESVLAS